MSKAKVPESGFGDYTDADTFGRLIRRLRIQEGLTIAELAKKASVSMMTVSTTERGRSIPGPTVLGRIATVLKIDLEAAIAMHVRQTMRDSMRRAQLEAEMPDVPAKN